MASSSSSVARIGDRSIRSLVRPAIGPEDFSVLELLAVSIAHFPADERNIWRKP